MSKPKTKIIERVPDQSPNMREELLAALRAITPEAFTEGRLDLEKLSQLTGPVEDKPERFSFTWSGKRDAIAMVQAPTRATSQRYGSGRAAARSGYFPGERRSKEDRPRIRQD